MTDFEQYSDHQLSIMVTEIINGCWQSEGNFNRGYALGSSGRVIYTTDYCKDITETWKLVLKYNIDIEMPHPLLGDIGTISIYNPEGMDWQVDFSDKNGTLRSIVICFLKMMEDLEND